MVGTDGTTEVYGMTAGHIFENHDKPISIDHTATAAQYHSKNSLSELQDGDDESGSDAASENGFARFAEDEFELEIEDPGTDSKTVEHCEATCTLNRSSPEHYRRFGRVVSRSADALEKTGRDLDWALISIDNPNFIKPNLLVINDQDDIQLNSAEDSSIVLNRVSKLKCRDARPGTPVWILTSHSVLSASLQPSAFIMASHARESIEVFVVQLTENAAEADFAMKPALPSAIFPDQGDSGSWVVDQLTKEVYGYTVASDVFQDVYVVPFYLAMNDMRDVTGAVSCDLLTDTVSAELRPNIPDSGYVSTNQSPTLCLDALTDHNDGARAELYEWIQEENSAS